MTETAFKESRSASFDIHNGDVHIWCVSLDDLSPLTGSLAQYLSEDEQARAGRFVFERGRDIYVVTRDVHLHGASFGSRALISLKLACVR